MRVGVPQERPVRLRLRCSPGAVEAASISAQLAALLPRNSGYRHRRRFACGSLEDRRRDVGVLFEEAREVSRGGEAEVQRDICQCAAFGHTSHGFFDPHATPENLRRRVELLAKTRRRSGRETDPPSLLASRSSDFSPWTLWEYSKVLLLSDQPAQGRAAYSGRVRRTNWCAGRWARSTDSCERRLQLAPFTAGSSTVNSAPPSG